jgi:hypothetical protein
VSCPEGTKGVEIRDVHPLGDNRQPRQVRRDLIGSSLDDHAGFPEVDEGAHGVGADEAGTAGDENHIAPFVSFQNDQ